MAERILPGVPKNVRGVINGIEYPMKLHYVGPTLGGHMWAASWPDGVEAPTWGDFTGLRMDELPAHTGVVCDLKEE